MSVHVIVGKNYGDEGKGLAVDYFSMKAREMGKAVLVARHNGGAQAGHTVDREQDRFIFHQLSSGSFRGADTLWTHTFLPDLYKLREELQAFAKQCDRLPRIYAQSECRLVLIDDVLLNMSLEHSRGENRHGSCGMGINEAVNRSEQAEYTLDLGTFLGQNVAETVTFMKRVRQEYLPWRMQKLGLGMEQCGEYWDLLADDGVLIPVAEEMHRAAEHVELFTQRILNNYQEFIFEGAQGLLLDNDRKEFYPYTTPSKTGCDNPNAFCQQYLPAEELELVYITRSYVTRHGRGPLPCDITGDLLGQIEDLTNIPNEWQESLRLAKHPDWESFVRYMREDAGKLHGNVRKSLMFTHMNETGRMLLFGTGDRKLDTFFAEQLQEEGFEKIYVSEGYLASDMDFFFLFDGNYDILQPKR